MARNLTVCPICPGDPAPEASGRCPVGRLLWHWDEVLGAMIAGRYVKDEEAAEQAQEQA